MSFFGQETTVGEILDALGGEVKTGPFGTVLKASEYSQSGVPVISVGEIGHGEFKIHERTPFVDHTVTTRLPEYVLRRDDIVFARKGSVDRSALVGPEQEGWFLGSDGIRLRVPGSVSARFVRYWISGEQTKSWLVQNSTGSTMASLNQATIRRLPIVLPSLTEQREIAATLGALDDKIELNRKTAAALEEMARALYRSWFVDFDPIHAKAGGLAPAHMDADTAALFPDSFGEDGLPEGWSQARYLDLVELISGGTPKTSEVGYWNGEIPWYSVADAPSRGELFVHNTEKTITTEGLKNSAAKLIDRGTTIISARGTVGKLAMAGRAMTFNQSCYGLRGRGQSREAFVYFATALAVKQLQTMSHGSVFATITRKTFERLSLPQCPDAVMAAFEDVARCFLARIHALGLENQTLATLRDTLLPRLMSGELRVPAARELVAEVA
ncbi:restriction endonuclease subunit S [Nitratireductor indicus]|uniref:restriction endonuclease subunit S n=1 Tax=Nitratireductor indicus TaxID=721133 RepID=UPI002875A4FC|nr:restriction endonuclease subunit S [Nitratireductor indicus]MDS1136720.1 restriction endonuclease subunit S [Nitratireductor indicus]